MTSILRTVLAMVLALTIGLILSFFLEGSARSDLGLGSYLAVGLFYGTPVLGIGFIMFLIINYLTKVRIRRRHFKNIHIFYFGISIAFGFVPVLGFAAFDYAHRGRFFNEPTFADLFFEYLPIIWLTGIAAVTNWILVWRRFENRAGAREDVHTKSA